MPATVTRPESLDALFRAAVAAIDQGDVFALQRPLADNPRLVHERLEDAGAWLRDAVGGALDAFFAKPYLLWFVAEDPVRNGTLPPNIAVVVEAGASLDTRDTSYDGTPLGWAEYGNHVAVADYLRGEPRSADQGGSRS